MIYGGGSLNKTRQSKHSLITVFMMAAAAALLIRLFVLTVAENEKWQAAAEDMSVRAVYETAPRGDILDRNGNVLASSRAVYSVVISRAGLEKDEAAESAAEVLRLLEGMDENVTVTSGEISEALSYTGYDSYMPVTIAENISEEAVQAIQDKQYDGVNIVTDYVRYYPNGALASHVLGYLGRISEEQKEEYIDEKGYRADAFIGKDGIEEKFEEHLKGTDSVSTLQVDSMGRVTKLLEKTEMKKGSDLTLTLDLELQKTVEEALQQTVEKASQGGVFESEYGDYHMTYAKNAASGAAVVLDIKTGEVLAMASFPDFDPNDFAAGISEEKWEKLQRSNEYDPLSPAPLYNVAAMTAVQPGSTFKPVTALAALNCGLDRSRYLYDDGAVRLGGRSYGCMLWNERGAAHGYVSLKEALKVSCNYYFYDIAAGEDFASGTSLDYDTPISNEVILNFADMLGLGRKTGIEINESAGVIPSAKLKAEGIKNSLRSCLLAESEYYFVKNKLSDRAESRKNIEKIVDLSDKDLTLDEIICKLKKIDFVKEDKIDELASVCKYTYFDQIEWNQGDTFNIAIGQGDNAYTTLQMANYMAVLANGGVNNGVTLIASDTEKEKINKKTTLNKEDVSYIIEAMTDVTDQADGSLYGVFRSFPYSVAAKTGTAQKAGKKNTEDEYGYLKRHLHLIAPGITMEQVEREAERLKKEYPDVYKSDETALRRAVINEGGRHITSEDIDRYKELYDSFAWTVAMAPADNPQIAVAVMLPEGKTSSNAAPAVREIIGKYGEISRWERLF